MRPLLAAIFFDHYDLFLQGGGAWLPRPRRIRYCFLFRFPCFPGNRSKIPDIWFNSFECKEIDNILFVTRQGNCVNSVQSFSFIVTLIRPIRPNRCFQSHIRRVWGKRVIPSVLKKKTNHKVGVEKNKLISHHLIILKNIFRKCYLI